VGVNSEYWLNERMSKLLRVQVGGRKGFRSEVKEKKFKSIQDWPVSFSSK
jgi:hypothetical protein